MNIEKTTIAMKKIFLAKSNGVELYQHSELVSNIAVDIAKQTMLKLDNDIIEGIRLGGLLHDIGKCTESFQKKLKGKNVDEENIEFKLPYRHNDVGWAFLSRYLNLPQNILNTILDTVYWHHGISNKMGDYTDTDIINDKFSETDLDSMKYYLESVVGTEFVCEKKYKPKKAPSYYVGLEN